MLRFRLMGLLACANLALACSDALEVGVPSSMEIVSGDGQTATVASAVAASLVVRVRDENGRPVSGARVTWIVAAGGGTIVATNERSDDQGRSSAIWTLGVVSGPQNVTATIESGASVTFTATAASGPAAALLLVSGDQQSASVGSVLPAKLTVRLVDRHGNGIPNAIVAWSIVSGGGNLEPTTAITAEDGTASTTWTLGPAVGQQTASAASANTVTVPFTASAAVGAPTRLVILDGNGQQGITSNALPVPLLVRALDRFGNPVPNALVSFLVTSGGGSVNPTTQPTDAQGTAASVWVLGAEPGSQSLEAVTGSVAGAHFTSTAYPPFQVTVIAPAAIQGAFETIDGITGYTCRYTWSIEAGGGLPGTVATWLTLTWTWRLKSNGATAVDESPVSTYWGAPTVTTGDSRVFQDSWARWSGPFTLKHTLRYRMSDGEERSAEHLMECR